VDNKAYIIDLKSDLIADVYGVKIAVPMDEKVFKKFTRKGINLDFIFEKSESGRQYLLLDCEEHRFDSILELLEKKKFHINRKGISYRPASNGKLYSWYILLDDNVETDKIQKHLIKKFPRLVEKLDQQLTEEYVNIQDKEISSLQEQNAVLAFENSKLYKQVQRYGKANKKMNEEFDKILSLVLEDVQFLRDSLDVLKNEIQDYSDPLKKLLQIRGDNELKATKINTLENWFELHFNTGQRDNGRIYFQRKSGKIHVLVTFKKEQKKDINYLKNY
jgi:regulator of replication initiation timing